MFSFFTVFVLILLTIYVSLMYKNDAIMLLVYMEAAFFVLSFFTIWYRKITTKAKLEVPIGISESGKDNLVKIKVKNYGISQIKRMQVYISVLDTLTGAKRRGWMKISDALRGENNYVQNIKFNGVGNYEICLEKLRVYDVTGLMYGSVKVKSIEKIQILPELFDVPVKLTLATKNFYGEAEVYDEERKGINNEDLFKIREYQKGDRLQRVHWKMTAKQDEIMVKEQSFPKSCPVIFCLDYNKKIKKAVNIKEYIEVAASISFAMMDAGCQHYVVWYDSEELDVKRIRVGDEESFFMFLGVLMNIKWAQPKEAVLVRYKEKYRSEIYVWDMVLKEDLSLKKGQDVLGILDEKNIEESLSQVELLL